MPGTAIVVINEDEWSVNVANTTAELIQGLSGVASILAGTGMLFILPAIQAVTVQTEQMLFAMDIIFISNGIVIDVARNIEPGYLVEEATPIDSFLEVNAGEAVDISAGDVVNITDYTIPAANDFGSIIASIMPLVVLGFLAPMLGGMLGGGSSLPKQLKSGNPKPPERLEALKEILATETIDEAIILRRKYRVVSLTPDDIAAIDRHLSSLREKERTGEYYWEITDIDTGEIIQKSKPYTTISKVYRSVRDYQRRRSGKDKEHLVVIRIYDTPEMEEWGKTIKYVMESGMHRGIPILIGKTPLQEAALDRLWPYSIIEVHDDGDLIIMSAGKKYVVTTEGGVFVHYTGEEALEKILGEPPFTWEIINHATGEKNVSTTSYMDRAYTLSSAFTFIEEELKRGRPKPPERGYEIKVIDSKGEVVYTEWYIPEWMKEGQHSISGEPRRRLVEEHGSWAVGRAEAICPEGDIACVTREAKRLIETLRSRYGEAVMGYVIVIEPGDTVFRSGDTVSMVAMERENKRVREFGGKEATYKT